MTLLMRKRIDFGGSSVANTRKPGLSSYQRQLYAKVDEGEFPNNLYFGRDSLTCMAILFLAARFKRRVIVQFSP